jgi:hypothetical protein
MARFPWLVSLRQLLIGHPLPTSAHHEKRYGNAEALAILSSDALSYTLPITVLIKGLMVIVGTSYRQTIRAYPQGAAPTCEPQSIPYKPISPWANRSL